MIFREWMYLRFAFNLMHPSVFYWLLLSFLFIPLCLPFPFLKSSLTPCAFLCLYLPRSGTTTLHHFMTPCGPRPHLGQFGLQFIREKRRPTNGLARNTWICFAWRLELGLQSLDATNQSISHSHSHSEFGHFLKAKFILLSPKSRS